MDWLLTITALYAQEFWALTGLVLLASIVRGFSGFGLSAVVMAVAVLFLPVIELVPMLWFLEMTGSLMMFKGGMQDADRTIARGLIIGSAIGLPVGLLLTMALPVETSKIIALTLLIALGFSQLARIRLPFLASTPGLYGSGTGAGIVTGLSGAGGMFIALYTLARDLPARTMRGTLSIYLIGAGILGLLTHILLGTMTPEAVARGAVFIIPTVIGIFLGQALFTERMSAYYRPVCLILLIGLASVGLIRTTLS